MIKTRKCNNIREYIDVSKSQLEPFNNSEKIFGLNAKGELIMVVSPDIITDGDGTKVLADNGKYIEITPLIQDLTDRLTELQKEILDNKELTDKEFIEVYKHISEIQSTINEIQKSIIDLGSEIEDVRSNISLNSDEIVLLSNALEGLTKRVKAVEEAGIYWEQF